MSNTTDEILDFIDGFHPVKKFFLNGYCYWFAKILIERFHKGMIYYLPIKNHFVVKISEQFFDANGIAEFDENPMLWSIYKSIEPVEAERIERDCIRKEWD